MARTPVTETRRPSQPASSWRHGLREKLPGVAERLPGVALATVVGLLAVLVAARAPVLSPVLLAILVGIGVGNLTGVAPRLRPGLDIAGRHLLRIGVALLGLQLVPGDVAALGWVTLAGVVVIVGAGVPLLLLLGRALGVPPARRLLVACGFSICGAAAVAAVGSATESEEEDTTAAIAMVVAFGTAALFVLPLLASLLGLAPVTAGTWAGGSVHEVGQVVAAGGMLGATALEVAVLVKLGRVVMLAPVITVLAARRRSDRGRRPALLPGFVAAFVGLVAVRGLVEVPTGVVAGVGWVQALTLAAAMFALGCGVDVRRLAARLGWRELALGTGGSAVVAGLALGVALLAR